MKTTIIKQPEIITEAVEEKEEEKYKIIVLTARPKEDKTDVYHTSSEIEKEAKKFGISVYLLFLEGAYLKKDEDGNRTVHNDEDEEGFAVSPKDTIAIIRGGIDRREIYKDLLSQIENAGIATVNSRDCIEICSDKYRTTLMLADA